MLGNYENINLPVNFAKNHTVIASFLISWYDSNHSFVTHEFYYRWTFDDAAAHLYYLMTSDSYSRYLRSSHYKDFIDGSRKKGGTRSLLPNLPKLTATKLNINATSKVQ